MSSSVGSLQIILVVNLTLALACVARPPMSPRGDRLNPNRGGEQPEVVTPLTTESTTPAVTGPIETPATVPTDAAPVAVAPSNPEVVAAVDEPQGPLEPTDGSSSVESGTGVNNGAGPVGTIFACKGEGAVLNLQGTAIPTYINGALVRLGKTYSIGCTTNFQDGIWNCQDFDSNLRITISKAGSTDYQAVITDKDTGGNAVTLGTMSCPAKI